MVSEVSKDTLSASSEAVERLEALAREATPGPWRAEEDTEQVWGACDPDDTTSYGMGVPVARAVKETPHWARNKPRLHLDWEQAASNARLIAAANPETILALISTLRSQAEALEAMKVERDLYRIVAVNQGWNWRMCDAYGRDEYQKHREEHVDECVAVAMSNRARAALTPEVSK